ncbi:bifunctional 2-keto-4-hydroxyglutarate aldolase/2-keto-3-deoxy-6-phosphogluconate aldolase [Eubacterium multiforme]|uniref:2-dehydro-3-deoxyphosphogluconate aldolase/(4S)-4-hydroxy-2-oxoglutarate aldolase n=1 Tax=Eubacterium multiforme TaxID=83339 RepID=A0ABT9UVV9_9FIRM|nr:bifunctional 2-keto-4-hydroxyglutarate aldolase/2-keto-3-deoxy-6-phosphogluconate aldolase [Eubacterium multiforme]MDQ0150419.1 2-dehydro-3-deoxyphosphogluconate aldolase/(4S)-4-hydroxy-2-oxoglutarate aldolase [Eubacterium multiforme]
MIKKISRLNSIEKEAFVLVLRADTAKEGIDAAKAAIDGGCKVVEVTFTIKDADEVIKTLVSDKNEDVVIGAGTVLDAETARVAILKGAEFIVSPCFSKETAIMCNRYGVPYIPGCFTVKEILDAREWGSDIVKLFPGSAFKPSIIKDIKAPIKDIGVMVSGGVSYDNISEWFKYGAEVVSIGSAITKLKDPEKIKKETEKYIKLVKDIKR